MAKAESAKSKTKPLTPAMEQWRNTKDQHPDKILFFRMGDFYELFFEDAKAASEKLGLTLTCRNKGSANPTPMAGVPHHQLERYVRELLLIGDKVAVCDQLEDPAQAKGVVKRGVTRIYTPGTVVEDSCLSSHNNNFLAAVTATGKDAGLACVDLSTGEFFAMQLDLETLGDELERLGPAETLIPKGAMHDGEILADALRYRAVGVLTERDDFQFSQQQADRKIKEHFGVSSLDGFGLSEAPCATGACGAALDYLQETQKTGLGHILSIRKVERSDHLILDRTTQRNLELTHALMEGGKKSTLLGVLDCTKTGPGGRMLKSWLLRPLARLQPILVRQQAIGELMEDHMLRAELRETLSGISDMERIMARVTTGRAGARDLASLTASLRMLPALATLGEQMGAGLLTELAASIDTLSDIEADISAALVEEPPATVKDGGMIRDGYNTELDELREISHGGKDWIAKFQVSEQERTGIPSLKIGFNKVFGYYIEITKAHKDKAPEDYERKQTLVNAERYITPELKEYEGKVLGAQERIGSLEYEIFVQLRDRVGSEVERIQGVARALANLDALAALAERGAMNKYCMPEVHEGLDTNIQAGRHPVLETMIPEGEFVSNDVVFDPEKSRVLVITGPNMAGKSTYIRQSALLTIMAQMGSPIPADFARVGLTDRVFTRVGAADDLARGQSTFMVEMSETANILNNATERSLVILDEVGRGTSTFDGVSLAWAITEYLHNKVKSRTLFATHYHELAELGLILDAAENCNIAVRDWGGEIIFLRKIQPGSCDRSYGIQVGRLAGIPRPVIDRARDILAGLEGQASDRDWSYFKEGEVLRAAAKEVQLDLFAPQKKDPDEFLKDLSKIDMNRISPMEAHEKLREICNDAKLYL